MAKKFAPKYEQYGNKNCRTVLNFNIKTLLEGSEIQYCYGVDTNFFLIKYFKYECTLCERLATHALVADCCKHTICLECALQMAD